MHKSRLFGITVSLLVLGMLSACSPGSPTGAAPSNSPLASETPLAGDTAAGASRLIETQAPPGGSEAPTAAATALTRPARGTIGLSAADGVAGAALEQLLASLTGAGVRTSIVSAEGDLRLQSTAAEGGRLAWERVLVPVDRMSSVLEGITIEELRGVWSGDAASPNFTTIYAVQAILPDLELLLGPAGPSVAPVAQEALADAVWGDPMSLGLAPFEALTVRLRALWLDGVSAADNRFAADAWPLTSRAWLVAATGRGEEALEKISGMLPLTNRDPDELTVLVMTGVTAMARNSAVAIERASDFGFLARRVGPELAAADLTLISNEIPFVAGCIANNALNNLILCSRPEYFLNLELSGVDAVGLSGNHQNDFGYANMRASLGFYEQMQIPVYGGGADDLAARKPLILEHNGNRLGFLGANQWGPESYASGTNEQVSAWAGPDNPGSARYERGVMNAAIQALAPRVDLVFAEVQHTEFNAAGDYQVQPIPLQKEDFRSMSDVGADVVTGVMAHAPQAVELRNGRLILYGLGNLYFDQTWSWPTRTGLVARHTIYDGRLINTELLVTVIETNFQLRWATPEERIQVLQSVFDVSRW